MSADSINISLANRRINQFAAIVMAASAGYCIAEFFHLKKTDDTNGLFLHSALDSHLALALPATIGFVLLVLVLMQLSWRIRSGSSWLAGTFLAVGIMVAIGNPVSYLKTVKLEDARYYLIDEYDFYSKWHAYSLCECVDSSRLCQCHVFFNAYSPIIGMDFALSANDATRELEVMLNGNLLYEFTRSPICIEQADVISYCENS